MIIYGLFSILGIFLLLFLESLVLSLFNFSFVVAIFFFLFKKVNWKILLFGSCILFLIFDVTNNLPLGSHSLIIALPLGLLIVSSVFFTIDSGFTSFLVRVLIFLVYYILLHLLPSLFSVGSFGFFTFNDFLSSLLKAVVSAFLLLLFEYLFVGFRKRGNTSQIRLK